MLQETSTETVKVTAMVFAILVGATAFSMVFTYSGGDTMVEEFIHNSFVNVGGLDGLRGNAFKVEQTKTKRRR
jgi:TRAP-type mannitol/chloroaromatic compound transport system permease large subunit